MGAPKWPSSISASVAGAAARVAVDAPGAERGASGGRRSGEHRKGLGEKAVERRVVTCDRRPVPRAGDACGSVVLRLEGEHAEGADGLALAGAGRLHRLRPRVKAAGV